jgi:hypothetical protein
VDNGIAEDLSTGNFTLEGGAYLGRGARECREGANFQLAAGGKFAVDGCLKLSCLGNTGTDGSLSTGKQKLGLGGGACLARGEEE